MKPYVVGMIFARGGSKGIPRKNLRLLAGKPLIAYAIDTAKASNFIQRVIVSTDDPEIAEVSRKYGAEVPFMRPPELAQDNSPEWLAWQHAIRTMAEMDIMPQMDIFVSIPPTSPLRSEEDVDACIRTLLSGDADIVITISPAHRSPYFNMVVLDESGYADLAIPPDRVIYQRQAAPVVYDITTVAYAARPEFILRAQSMFEGKVKAVMVPQERALDIDTGFDLKIAESILGGPVDRCA